MNIYRWQMTDDRWLMTDDDDDEEDDQDVKAIRF